VLAVCAGRGLTDIAFVGHSMGAIVALAATLEAGARGTPHVRGALLVCPPGRQEVRRIAGLLRDPILGPAWRLGLAFETRCVAPVAALLGHRLGMRVRRLAAGRHCTPGFLRESLLRLPDAGVYDRLGEIAVPVLILSGGLDYATPSAGARALAGALPNARHVHWRVAGHHPMDERPNAFRRLVAGWLGERVTTSTRRRG
jgi:pimeloyl-ACP methyl ester carboxylesterase